MLAEAFEELEMESGFVARPSTLLASGAQEPLLGLPDLGFEENEC